MNIDAVTNYVSRLPWDGLPRGAAAQLARDCNLTDASVSKWKQGHSAPTPNHWRAIEELFRLKPHTIAEVASTTNMAQVDQLRTVAAQIESIRQMLAALDEQLARVVREIQDTPIVR